MKTIRSNKNMKIRLLKGSTLKFIKLSYLFYGPWRIKKSIRCFYMSKKVADVIAVGFEPFNRLKTQFPWEMPGLAKRQLECPFPFVANFLNALTPSCLELRALNNASYFCRVGFCFLKNIKFESLFWAYKAKRSALSKMLEHGWIKLYRHSVDIFNILSSCNTIHSY